MITASYCQTMARYNRWQNHSLYREADRLDDAERNRDRGAFFGSIQRTLGHIMWGDIMWMARLDGTPPPDARISEGGCFTVGWEDLKSMRLETDATLSKWAAQITDEQLNGDLTWRSVFQDADQTHAFSLLVMHVFNHQTHHRGQVHAMLTAAGLTPDATDLPFMPDTF